MIVPQLAGPGVAAHLVAKATGFSVRYGPVRAADLPAYLDGGLQATATMRYKGFPFVERLLLSPLEILLAVKGSLPFFVLLALGLGFVAAGGESYLNRVLAQALAGSKPYLAGILGGTVLAPLFLPLLPGRAFAVKGAVAGMIASLGLLPLFCNHNWLQGTGALLLTVVLSSYWGMKFTGASPYTSLSGVRKEMRLAVPLQIVGGVVGLGCWFAAGLG